MNPNWKNNRRNFNNFGGWNQNQNFQEPPFMDEMDDDFFGNRFGFPNNGRGGGPPRRGRGGFNPDPPNWGGPSPPNYGGPPPPNFGGPPPPNFGSGPPNMYTWGRGFGPTGPPKQHPRRQSKAISYLVRCGVPKERLKNLPRDFLRLITPERCGLCDVTLESFNLSREHYASKGHFKRQNKWMAEQRNKGSQHSSHEAPLKSRDLYCELCDVQITSKVHADSHYEGKPHRAIVEGRKKPKNVSLLVKSMAGRIEQLIRREKKFIKYVPETEKTEEELAQAKGMSQPELYCKICKTSVTCTEQMTMHLNGKRHLSKEKQHILKMMKGDDAANEDKEEEDAEGGEEEADDNDNEETEDNGEGDDKYDWGNGSGAWDEDVKT